MTISVGDTLPDATLLSFGENGPEPKELASLTKGKKTVIFALPGAFTSTCSVSHLPSFMRTADAFRAKGVEHILCISVNDPFVMGAWDNATGASAVGISMLADSDGSYTAQLGMDFSAPPVGLLGRSKRYAMLVDDGTVSLLQCEESPGECSVSSGEALLEAMS